MSLQNPPVFEHGFVVGRYVTAVADSFADEDRYPDLRPITGRIRFTPLQTVHLKGGEYPATVVKQPITVHLDDQGYIVDVESRDAQNRAYANHPEYVSRLNSPDEEDAEGNAIPLDVPEELRWRPGLYLAVGNYRVEPVFENVSNISRFTIQVTAEHTKEDPLDLTLAAPIETPPGFTEVVRIADRVRAEDAAENAESHAASTLVYRDEAAQSATDAEAHSASAGESAETAEGHADRAEQARDEAEAITGIEVDTSAGTKVTIGGHVVHYDSGWRDLVTWDGDGNFTSGDSGLLYGWEPYGGTPGALSTRRINDTVYYRATSIICSAGGNSGFGMPSGFRPGSNDFVQTQAYARIRPSGEDRGVDIMLGATRNFTTGAQGKGADQSYGLTWQFITSVSLPSSLPGTPA